MQLQRRSRMGAVSESSAFLQRSIRRQVSQAEPSMGIPGPYPTIACSGWVVQNVGTGGWLMRVT